MSVTGALGNAELVFEMLALPNPDSVKRMVCLRFLETWPMSTGIEPECSREYAAIVAAAVEYGANWTAVGEAVGLDAAEAQRRWGRH